MEAQAGAATHAGYDGMQVSLDLQAAQSRTFGERGISRWSRSYAASLVTAGVPLDSVLFNPAAPRPVLPSVLESSGLVRWNTATEVARWEPGSVAYHLLSPFERGRPLDSVLPDHALRGAGAVVATLYDAIPFVMAGWYLNDDSTRRFMEARRRLLAEADLVLAISECTRRDGIEVLGLDPDRVVTIGSGGAELFCAGDGPEGRSASFRAAQRALPALEERFVLTVSGWLPHKNLLALIDAWGRVPVDVRAGRQLVVVCTMPPEALGVVAERVRQAGLPPEAVLVAGYCPDETLGELYRSTDLFVFPSLYEGFGLPVLEAAQLPVRPS